MSDSAASLFLSTYTRASNRGICSYVEPGLAAQESSRYHRLRSAILTRDLSGPWFPMPKRVILLSGPIGAGKTTLGDAFVQRYGFHKIKTRELIQSFTNTEASRSQLQKAGEQLDAATNGEWVASALRKQVANAKPDAVIIVDSVRISPQVDAIRKIYGGLVKHIHLSAPQTLLAIRYAQRSGEIQELASYDAVKESLTERNIDHLQDIADIVIDTEKNSPEDVFVRVASHLGLYGRSVDRLVDVLVGGQFGSEGKGHISAYLSPEYDLLIRVGGPNAGHRVYETPKPYTFHHLPSGTRASRAKIALGAGAVIGLPRLLEEISDCQLTYERLAIDPQAIIINEFDVQFEQQSLAKLIGSTAQGVGSATARKILRSSASPPVKLAKDVAELKPFVRETLKVLDDSFANGERIFLEGTQGTGLSLHHGNYPYVTSRDTTVSGTLADAGIAPSRVRKIVMVCRSYPIRVQDPNDGTSGPMGHEISWNIVSERSGLPLDNLLATERTSTTGRKRRVAEFSWTLFRKSVSLNGPTDIALTFADYIDGQNQAARRFDQLTQQTIRFIGEVERVAGVPVSLISTRFDQRSIIDRRTW